MKSIQLFEFDMMAFVNHTSIMGAPTFALILYIIAYVVVYKIDSNLAPPFQNNHSFRIFKSKDLWSLTNPESSIQENRKR